MSGNPQQGQTQPMEGYNDADRIGPWQERLQQHCATHGLGPPIYSVASDRRGGRTAWSCTVEVNGQTIPSRYWFDGNWVYNAKEDAAQYALERLGAIPTAQPTYQKGWGTGQ